MKKLAIKDILALSFLTFAFFVGAGNIIFPPMIGLQAGHQVWWAAIGFVITAVGLPVLTIIALARADGIMDHLCRPIGQVAGISLSVICYLLVGPLFAIPRTATVSYEVGLQPFLGSHRGYLLLFSAVYFVIVFVVSLYPGKILETIGQILAPIKIMALIILGVFACLYPVGGVGIATDIYTSHTGAIGHGIVNGYLTMDTLGALVFGIVIVNAIRSLGINTPQLITRYAIIAALMAGIGLTLVYLSLFKLGSDSYLIAFNAANGAEVLNLYVKQLFGASGNLFLAFLITLACMVTAIGLSTACAEYFSELTGKSYRLWLTLVCVASFCISNLGLTELIHISVPILTVIYPPCIVLVLLSFFQRYWCHAQRVVVPVVVVSIIFGIFDGLEVAELTQLIPEWITYIPYQRLGLAWVVPSCIATVLVIIMDKIVPVVNKNRP